MSESIPNTIYKRAAAICGQFPNVGFLDIAQILYEDSSHCSATEGSEHSNKEWLEVNKIEAAEEHHRHVTKNRINNRKHYCRFVIGGVEHSASNKKLAFSFLHIEPFYGSVFCNPARRTLERQAEKIAELLFKKMGLVLNSFSMFGFDGNFYTVYLDELGKVTNKEIDVA